MMERTQHKVVEGIEKDFYSKTIIAEQVRKVGTDEQI